MRAKNPRTALASRIARAASLFFGVLSLAGGVLRLLPGDDARAAGSVLLLEGAVPVLAGICLLLQCNAVSRLDSMRVSPRTDTRSGKTRNEAGA